MTPQMSDLDDLTLSIEGRTVDNHHLREHPYWCPPDSSDTQQTSQIPLKNGGSDWMPRQRILTQYYVRALKTWEIFGRGMRSDSWVIQASVTMKWWLKVL